MLDWPAGLPGGDSGQADLAVDDDGRVNEVAGHGGHGDGASDDGGGGRAPQKGLVLNIQF